MRPIVHERPNLPPIVSGMDGAGRCQACGRLGDDIPTVADWLDTLDSPDADAVAAARSVVGILTEAVAAARRGSVAEARSLLRSAECAGRAYDDPTASEAAEAMGIDL